MDSQKEVAQAIAVNALASWAGRTKERSVLDDGTSHAVALNVTGLINGQRISPVKVHGVLETGVSNPTGSTKNADLSRLLALALENMPATKREAFFAAWTKKKTLKKGALKEPSPETVKSLAALRSRLATQGPKAGAVKFIG